MRTRWLMLISWAISGVGASASFLTYYWYVLLCDQPVSELKCGIEWIPILAAPHLLASIGAWVTRESFWPRMVVVAGACWFTAFGLLITDRAISDYHRNSSIFESGNDWDFYSSKSVYGPMIYGLVIGFSLMALLQAPVFGCGSLYIATFQWSQRQEAARLAAKGLEEDEE